MKRKYKPKDRREAVKSWATSSSWIDQAGEGKSSNTLPQTTNTGGGHVIEFVFVLVVIPFCYCVFVVPQTFPTSNTE